MPERSSCRLLSLDGPAGALTHGALIDLLDELSPGDLLVFNSTHVTPAHLSERRANGDKIEMLVERMLDEKHILAHIRISKAPKPDTELLLGDDEDINATITARRDALFKAELDDGRSVPDTLNGIGHIPLPPYIDRPDEDVDRELYQTVYSEKPDAVAALTAGLHFDEPLLERLRTKGVGITFAALRAGVGIFQPVHADTTEDHIIHSEHAEISQGVVSAVLAAEVRGNRVIAVGTASVRSLESAAQAARNDLTELSFDDTQIFIHPGFQYRMVDALVTNFHPPESTLIMLVSVFAGYQHTMNTYKAAVEEKYRSFSYDNTMFITYSPQVVSERIGEQFRGAGLNVGLLF